MIDFTKAFEVGEDGIAICDSNNNFKFFLLSGQASPIGALNPPQPSIYIDGSSNIFRKTGPTALDWTSAVSSDVQSGVFEIISGECITVEPRREMRIKSVQTNFGTLKNFGRVVVD